MDDNRGKRSEDTDDRLEIDGEYHFVRPEKKLYEDAKFVPQDEPDDVPQYYVPSEKKPKEKKAPANVHSGKIAKLVCLGLACAIIGGLVGGFVSWTVLKHRLPEESSDKPIVSSNDNSGSSHETAVANDVYAAGCRQTVGIAFENTSTNIFGQTSVNAVAGTGFIMTSDGYIITNYHVIEPAHEYNLKVNVSLKDGSTYQAAIVGFEEASDIALLKIDATDLSPVTIGNSNNIAVGDSVFAIGHPLGELEFSMTGCRISALSRSITPGRSAAPINLFQLDVSLSSGSSGGPVFNESGEVIGIVTVRDGLSEAHGTGFAIPINDAVGIANDLITKGYVSGKAYLGVNIDNHYTSVYAQYYNLPEGAYVHNVEPESCAENCGLAAGDIITQIGDEPIKSYSDLNAAVKQFNAGDSTEIVVYRKNEFATLTVTFDESQPSTGSNGVNEYGISSLPQSG